MKRIGLLGGMSWESSAEYYRLINEEVRERLGATDDLADVCVCRTTIGSSGRCPGARPLAR